MILPMLRLHSLLEGDDMRFLFGLILCLCCWGCQQHYVLVGQDRLRQLVNSTWRDGAAGWVYLGTDDKYHYFVRQYYWINALLNPPLGPQCLFKVNKNELEIVDTFKPSRDAQGQQKGRSVFESWKLRTVPDGSTFYSVTPDFNNRGDLGDSPSLDSDMRKYYSSAPATSNSGKLP
jgi:hypothetical protein